MKMKKEEERGNEAWFRTRLEFAHEKHPIGYMVTCYETTAKQLGLDNQEFDQRRWRFEA